MNKPKIQILAIVFSLSFMFVKSANASKEKAITSAYQATFFAKHIIGINSKCARYTVPHQNKKIEENLRFLIAIKLDMTFPEFMSYISSKNGKFTQQIKDNIDKVDCSDKSKLADIYQKLQGQFEQAYYALQDAQVLPTSQVKPKPKRKPNYKEIFKKSTSIAVGKMADKGNSSYYLQPRFGWKEPIHFLFQIRGLDYGQGDKETNMSKLLGKDIIIFIEGRSLIHWEIYTKENKQNIREATGPMNWKYIGSKLKKVGGNKLIR